MHLALAEAFDPVLKCRRKPRRVRNKTLTELQKDLGWKGPLESSSPTPAPNCAALCRACAVCVSKDGGCTAALGTCCSVCFLGGNCGPQPESLLLQLVCVVPPLPLPFTFLLPLPCCEAVEDDNNLLCWPPLKTEQAQLLWHLLVLQPVAMLHAITRSAAACGWAAPKQSQSCTPAPTRAEQGRTIPSCTSWPPSGQHSPHVRVCS